MGLNILDFVYCVSMCQQGLEIMIYSRVVVDVVSGDFLTTAEDCG